MALGIAWAAAAGGSFLGWQASRPHRVLYIDGEMAATDMKQRLLMFGSAPPTLEFMMMDLQNGLMSDLGYLQGQLTLARNWDNPELVVFDNLASLTGFNTGNPDCWNDLQRFLIVQRKLGRAMLLVHHANKKRLQRGTNRREDVLDLVMALRRPADHQPKNGARFEIHFEKARGLFGDAVEPIEARLESDQIGVGRWTWRPAHVGDLERVVEMLKAGLNAAQVAQELRISRSRTYRLRDQAMKMGLVAG